jgi:hypothetical protein
MKVCPKLKKYLKVFKKYIIDNDRYNEEVTIFNYNFVQKNGDISSSNMSDFENEQCIILWEKYNILESRRIVLKKHRSTIVQNGKFISKKNRNKIKC